MAAENENKNDADIRQNDKYTIKDISRAEREDETRISDEALMSYATQALSEVEGIVVSNTGIVGGLLGKKGGGRGIKIDSNDQEVVITVTLELEFGIKIPEVSRLIQQKIRYNIEEFTGKFVRAVNVNIEGVRQPSSINQVTAPPEASETPDQNKDQ